MLVNYISMTGFALFMGGFSTMLYYIGVGMGYLYLLMGVIISSAVVPATFTLVWKDQVSECLITTITDIHADRSPLVLGCSYFRTGAGILLLNLRMAGYNKRLSGSVVCSDHRH